MGKNKTTPPQADTPSEDSTPQLPDIILTEEEWEMLGNESSEPAFDLNDLTPEEKAELEKALKEVAPPEDSMPQLPDIILTEEEWELLGGESPEPTFDLHDLTPEEQAALEKALKEVAPEKKAVLEETLKEVEPAPSPASPAPTQTANNSMLEEEMLTEVLSPPPRITLNPELTRIASLNDPAAIKKQLLASAVEKDYMRFTAALTAAEKAGMDLKEIRDGKNRNLLQLVLMKFTSEKGRKLPNSDMLNDKNSFDMLKLLLGIDPALAYTFDVPHSPLSIVSRNVRTSETKLPHMDLRLLSLIAVLIVCMKNKHVPHMNHALSKVKGAGTADVIWAFELASQAVRGKSQEVSTPDSKNIRIRLFESIDNQQVDVLKNTLKEAKVLHMDLKNILDDKGNNLLHHALMQREQKLSAEIVKALLDEDLIIMGARKKSTGGYIINRYRKVSREQVGEDDKCLEISKEVFKKLLMTTGTLKDSIPKGTLPEKAAEAAVAEVEQIRRAQSQAMSTTPQPQDITPSSPQPVASPISPETAEGGGTPDYQPSGASAEEVLQGVLAGTGADPLHYMYTHPTTPTSGQKRPAPSSSEAGSSATHTSQANKRQKP